MRGLGSDSYRLELKPFWLAALPRTVPRVSKSEQAASNEVGDAGVWIRLVQHASKLYDSAMYLDLASYSHSLVIFYVPLSTYRSARVSSKTEGERLTNLRFPAFKPKLEVCGGHDRDDNS